ncbi:MAG TPA: hypothetical protein VJR89_16700 [Polyangiales bacterium]|nr:hypothetical protein [Polyangiales bacterium]
MPSTRDLHKTAGWIRRGGVALGLLLATGILLMSVQRHYPIEQWLFWRYAKYWIAALVWSLGCASLGHRLLRALLGQPLPFLEQLAISQALGVFAFQLIMYVLGMLGLYSHVTFYALPLACLLAGGRPFARSLRRAWHHYRSPRRRSRLSLVAWIAILFGVTALIALYLPTMSPFNASFDAHWRHMYIAEQYAVHGGIRRFDEGWALGASPHFTCFLYTWGYLYPFGQLFDRVELCAHIEFVVFLWTTFTGVPALVRRLVPHANPAAVWAARFLFPGTFLYDSNLSVGADHIGALFAPPLLLACLRFWRAPNAARGLVLGALIAAAVSAKETTALLLAPFPILLVMVRFGYDAALAARRRTRSWQRLGGPIVAGLATIVLTSPHWLKNLLWYGDPLYPNLYAHFHDRPWGPNAAYDFEYGFKSMLWAPQPNLQGLREALEATITFSFRPHAWWQMHRDVPVLGSLFTLLVIVLPLLRGVRRIWLVVACVHVSVFAWFWVHHEDRHLQALVPWMAASVAATATLIWRHAGSIARVCLALLVCAQAVWGSDVYFIPTHSMVGGPGLKAPMDLLAQGYLGNYDRRLDFQIEQVLLGSYTPKHSVILVHENRDQLGFGRKTVADHTGDQFGIDYLELGAPDRVYQHLHKLGVTHIVWREGMSVGIAPLGADIAFFDFVYHHTTRRQGLGTANIAELPATPPPAPNDGRLVAVLGCGIGYNSGVYRLPELRTPRFGPAKDLYHEPDEPIGTDWPWRDRVFAIAIDTFCQQPSMPKAVLNAFVRVARRDERWGRGHELWLRKLPEPEPAAPAEPAPEPQP